MLNSAGNNSFFDLVSVYLKVFDHLTFNIFNILEVYLLYTSKILKILKVLNSDFLKFRILEILNFHPCVYDSVTF